MTQLDEAMREVGKIATTDPVSRCEPPPGLREKDGWRWLKQGTKTWPAYWGAPLTPGSDGHWFGGSDPKLQYEHGCRYLCPLPRPDEFAALVRAATAMRKAADALYMNRHAGRQLREQTVKAVTDLSEPLAAALSPFFQSTST